MLSFPFIERAPDDPVAGELGDIVISVETAIAQGNEIGHGLEAEAMRLAIHGLLHLLGYDHEGVSKAMRSRMEKTEEELFNLAYASIE